MHRSPAQASFSFQNISSFSSREPWSLALTSFFWIELRPRIAFPFSLFWLVIALSFGVGDGLGFVFLKFYEYDCGCV
jgi:hypothetical protein